MIGRPEIDKSYESNLPQIILIANINAVLTQQGQGFRPLQAQTENQTDKYKTEMIESAYGISLLPALLHSLLRKKVHPELGSLHARDQQCQSLYNLLPVPTPWLPQVMQACTDDKPRPQTSKQLWAMARPPANKSMTYIRSSTNLGSRNWNGSHGNCLLTVSISEANLEKAFQSKERTSRSQAEQPRANTQDEHLHMERRNRRDALSLPSEGVLPPHQ